MAARKSKRTDLRNMIIAVLLVVVGVEFFFLYQSNEQLREFFVHAPQKQAVVKKTVKKQPPSHPTEQSVLTPVYIDEDPKLPPAFPVPVVSKQATANGKKAYVAIVIDDWGYSTKNCQYLREIKQPVTVAVLPDLAHSSDVMECAHQAGKEIMLHLPMEAHNNTDSYPPDYILKTDMSPIKIDRLLTGILDKMPLVEGVNNHMGSKATEDKAMMSTVFKQLKFRGLFFMDSRVTAKSVCAPLAKQTGIPFASRDVFLDNVNERPAIKKELAELVKIAKKRGKAIAIGHDRTLTMQVIEESIPSLKEQGIEFVSVKDYINIK
jgi:polysaccharide deacetylase 2 family uncharacterized protein YibQ